MFESHRRPFVYFIFPPLLVIDEMWIYLRRERAVSGLSLWDRMVVAVAP
jgi:hypothetical protein